jgi:hypothetical protein
MWSMPEAIELAWEHAYPGREAAERNEWHAGDRPAAQPIP